MFAEDFGVRWATRSDCEPSLVLTFGLLLTRCLKPWHRWDFPAVLASLLPELVDIRFDAKEPNAALTFLLGRLFLNRLGLLEVLLDLVDHGSGHEDIRDSAHAAECREDQTDQNDADQNVSSAIFHVFLPPLLAGLVRWSRTI